jgi:hypothetical protein
MASVKKVTVTHPVSGTERKFDETIYEPIRKAIMHTLKGSPGKTFSQLADDVRKYLREKNIPFKGSVPWYTISVRLDLETRGVVETFTEKGRKFSRLKK